jgi:hypothetical protein
MAEINPRKSTHNFRTHKARVWRRAASRRAVSHDRASRGAAALKRAFFSVRDCNPRKAVLSPRQIVRVKEHLLRTKLIICTEADYLQAHLTVIEGKSRGSSLTLHHAKQRVTSVLRKWILAVNDTCQRNPIHCLGFVLGRHSGFGRAQNWQKRRSGCPPPSARNRDHLHPIGQVPARTTRLSRLPHT